MYGGIIRKGPFVCLLSSGLNVPLIINRNLVSLFTNRTLC